MIAALTASAAAVALLLSPAPPAPAPGPVPAGNLTPTPRPTITFDHLRPGALVGDRYRRAGVRITATTPLVAYHDSYTGRGNAVTFTPVRGPVTEAMTITIWLVSPNGKPRTTRTAKFDTVASTLTDMFDNVHIRAYDPAGRAVYDRASFAPMGRARHTIAAKQGFSRIELTFRDYPDPIGIDNVTTWIRRR